MTKKNNLPLIIKSIRLDDKRGGLDKFVDYKIINSLKFKTKEIQISKSKENVFRGIYMQVGKFKEAKLIKLLNGSLVWFGLDLRKNSRNYLKLYAFNLKENETLYLPRGFAHASYSINYSEVLILADNKYNNKHSIGINYKDKKFNKKISNYFKYKKPIISNWHNNFEYFEIIEKKIK